MKHLLAAIIAVSFAAVPFAQGVVVFDDDFESVTTFAPPNPAVGSWAATPNTVDGFFLGIPDNPFADVGDVNIVKLQRGLGNLAVAAYTATTGNFDTVHAEFDMYMDESTGAGLTNFTAFGMMHDLRMLNCGRNDCGWFPNIDVRESGGMNSAWNDLGIWTNSAALGSRPAVDTWQHYEFDYTVGVTTSLVMTVTDGVSTTNVFNLPPPWGWDAFGQDVDDPPGAREAAVQMVGLAWYNNGPDATSLTYIDEVLIEFQNGVTQFTSNVVSAPLDDASALSFDSADNLEYGLEYTEDVTGSNDWIAAEWTVPGDDGILYLFDPNDPTGAVEKTYRIRIK